MGERGTGRRNLCPRGQPWVTPAHLPQASLSWDLARAALGDASVRWGPYPSPGEIRGLAC